MPKPRAMALSERTAWPTAPSPWAEAVQRARAAGRVGVDLTNANPTAVGLLHPPEVYTLIGDAADARYAPESAGLLAAREAVTAYYARPLPAASADDAARVDIQAAPAGAVDPDPLATAPPHPDAVWLCASTSEAYSQILTLLCDPGDAIAVARPGYPLLQTLAQLAAVRVVEIPTHYDGRWSIDLAAAAGLLDATPRLRAIVSVSPNNPTGASLSRAERDHIDALCQRHGAAHIVDEVFADFPHTAASAVPRAARLASGAPVSFVVSGLSKVAALPQMKLAWVVVGGVDRGLRQQVLSRAHVLADATLSAAPPMQRCLPAFLAAAERIQPAIRTRLAHNRRAVCARARGAPWDVLAADAGWTALLRMPQGVVADDEAWAHALLTDAGIVTNPGYLFDAAPAPPLLAVSLLTPVDDFATGTAAMAEAIAARLP